MTELNGYCFPGMLVKSGRVPVSRSETLLAASQSLVQHRKLRAVYVMDSNGKPRLRQVRTGKIADGEDWKFLAGVSAGDRWWVVTAADYWAAPVCHCRQRRNKSRESVVCHPERLSSSLLRRHPLRQQALALLGGHCAVVSDNHLTPLIYAVVASFWGVLAVVVTPRRRARKSDVTNGRISWCPFLRQRRRSGKRIATPARNR